MRLWIAVSLSLLCAATSMRSWFQHLKEGLTESSTSAQRQRGSVAAVAAVRGLEQAGADLEKPAWKSGAKTRKSKEVKAQRQEFSAAVDLAVEGKYAEADEKLEAFEKAHPGSSLLSDVKETRQKVKEAQAQAQASDAKPAQ
jgi:TolA-binding protein